MRDSNWERWAARLARGIDRHMDGVRNRVLGDRLARQVVPYRGFGTTDEVFISGRVLANRPTRPVSADDAWWRNLTNALRHLESDEVAAARVRIRFAGTEHEALTDDEGYFRAWLKPRDPLPPDALWHVALIDVPERVHPDAGRVHATAPLLLPHPDTEFLVISDIDDTVIRTEATRMLRMLKRTLLENARTRLPFAGVAEFYAALHTGARGNAAGNPVFYVSSSPWNLYGILTEFLEHQNIPLGPIVLRDWGITDHGVLPTRHGVHKLGAIRQILDTYPSLPVILIGDSGQEDPEIYRDVVHEHGDRILAVYIRNVTPGARAHAIAALSEEVRGAGSELLLSDDTLASARHAAGRGWIRPDAVARVEAEVRSSAARPG